MMGTKEGRWPQAETTFKVINNLHRAKNKLKVGIFYIESATFLFVGILSLHVGNTGKGYLNLYTE